jgi:hypothetical protein
MRRAKVMRLREVKQQRFAREVDMKRFNRRQFRKVMRSGLVVLLLGTWPTFACAGALDSIQLQPGAKVLRASDASIAAKGASGSDIFVPTAGTFTIDYAVEGGKELMITMITNEQYQQLATGRKLDGSPLLKVVVSGIGRQSVQLARGNYFIAFNDVGGTGTRVSYRASFR